MKNNRLSQSERYQPLAPVSGRERAKRHSDSPVPPVYDLLDMEDPMAVHEEAKRVLRSIQPSLDTERLDRAYAQVLRLFRGEHPDYEACNTGFHNLKHTTDVYLAMARMLHGSFEAGYRFSERELIQAQIVALFHDIGYLKDRGDTEGTGAKHTRYHEERSADMLASMADYFELTDEEIASAREMIACTNLAIDIDTIRFSKPNCALLGKLLGTADLLAQTAERTYLEKLLFLYYEFREGRIGDYTDELDLLRKSRAFFELMEERLSGALDNLQSHMVHHFRQRWGVEQDLYRATIQRQLSYLESILAKPGDPRNYLQRGEVVDEVKRRFHSA